MDFKVFLIDSVNSKKSYVKLFRNVEEAREWVENHLDLSKNWMITPWKKK